MGYIGSSRLLAVPIRCPHVLRQSSVVFVVPAARNDGIDDEMDNVFRDQ